MVPLFLLSFVFLLIIDTTSSLTHHVININSSTLQFSSLAWDATARHFVVGSAMGPVVYAISDEGTIKCLLSEHSSNSNNGVFVTALAVDQIRHRLIVTFSNPSSVSAYDLKSYRRIYAMPLPQLDGTSSGVVVDLESGEVLVSSANRGVLLKVGPYGDTLQEIVLSAQIKLINNVSNLVDTSVGNNHTLNKRIISELKNFDDGLGGIMYLSHGCILVLQTTTGKIFKVDTIDGTVTEVLHRDSSIPLAPSGHAMSLQTEKSIVVATNQSLLLIESDDNRWARAATIRNKMNMEEGEMVVAIAMQEGEKENVYVLVNYSKKGYRIEEVIWRESNYGSWCLVLGLFIFLLLWFMWVEYSDGKPFYGNWDWKGYDHENVTWFLILSCFLWVFVLFWFIWDAFFNDKIKAI